MAIQFMESRDSFFYLEFYREKLKREQPRHRWRQSKPENNKEPEN